MNCIIIHGCPSNAEKAMDPERRTYDKHWIPWTKSRLNELGIQTETPLMPNPWEPVYEAFKEEFEKQKINEDTILIGHSCGCAFLVRWLGDTKRKIKRLILVAPWKKFDPSNELEKNFYNFEIDKTIPEKVSEIIMFTSNDEEPEGHESLEIYKTHLGGKIISLEDHGHYILDDMGTEEFPELIEAVTE